MTKLGGNFVPTVTKAHRPHPNTLNLGLCLIIILSSAAKPIQNKNLASTYTYFTKKKDESTLSARLGEIIFDNNLPDSAKAL